jgi:zinc protease
MALIIALGAGQPTIAEAAAPGADATTPSTSSTTASPRRKPVARHAKKIAATDAGKRASTTPAPDRANSGVLPAGVTPGPQVEGIAEYRLANGLKILLLPDASADTVTINVTYLVGSRNEGYGESGMAHLLEHMVFKGTPTRGDLKAELTRRGARFNGTTSLDRTNYFETLSASDANLDWALAMEADRMVNSRVARSDLDTEMTVVRNEFESGENNPSRVLLERMAASAYSWHAYGRSIIGARSDIENVPIERLQAFYRLYYQPDNAVLVMAGRLDPARALSLAARHFGPIAKPTRSLPRTYTVEPTQDGERTVTLRRAGDVQIVAALYHVLPGSHPDYAALDLLVSVLSSQPSGRLHRQLVQSGLAARTFGAERQQREAGTAYFGATVGLDGAIDPARQALLDVLDGVARDPITAEELERARTALLADHDALTRDSRAMAITLSEYAAMGDWRLLFWYRDRVKAMRLEDVQQAALSYLKPDNRTIGQFIPTANPDRSIIPPSPDVQSLLKDYTGGTAIASGESFEASPSNIERRTRLTTERNDMRFALLPRKTRGERVVARIDLNLGDEASLTGRTVACDAAGSMLMRGSQRHSRSQIEDRLDQLRTRLSVDMGGASIETTREHLPEVLALAVEILREPAFPADEFEQLKRSALASIAASRSDPGARASNELTRHISPYPPEHPRYTSSIEEDEQDWKKLSLDAARRCHGDLAGASSAIISVVGDFDPGPIEQQLRELLGNWRSPVAYRRVAERSTRVSAISREIVTPDKANAVWRAALTVPLRDDAADYPALALANYLIGGHAGARLWTRVREKEGLSYSVGSSLSASAHDPFTRFQLSAIHAPQNRDRVEAAILGELRRAITDGFSATEVAEGRASALEARRVGRTQDSSIANRWVTLLEAGRTWAWDEAFDRRLLTLTADEVNAALRKYIDPAALSIVSAGDFRATAPGTASQSPGNAPR